VVLQQVRTGSRQAGRWQARGTQVAGKRPQALRVVHAFVALRACLLRHVHSTYLAYCCTGLVHIGDERERKRRVTCCCMDGPPWPCYKLLWCFLGVELIAEGNNPCNYICYVHKAVSRACHHSIRITPSTILQYVRNRVIYEPSRATSIASQRRSSGSQMIWPQCETTQRNAVCCKRCPCRLAGLLAGWRLLQRLGKL
jgi:hypothetical protein